MKKLFVVLAICCGLFFTVTGCLEEKADNATSTLLLLTGGATVNVDCLNIDPDMGACYTNVARGWCTGFNGDVQATGWCTSNGYTDCVGNRCTTP